MLSNASKSRFPDNTAAQFTIPIDDAQQLTGEWEVAIAQLSYSNCLYTFNNEVITLKEKRTKAYQCDEGCRVYIPRWSDEMKRSDVTKFIIDFLNKTLEKIATFTPDKKNKFISHKIENGWMISLSPSLQTDLGFQSDTLTSYDNYPSNDISKGGKTIPYKRDYYIHLIAKNEKTFVKKIVLKSKNMDMIPETLLGKFNYLLQMDGEQVAKMTYEKTTGHITIEKLRDDDLVLLCSKSFHQFLKHRSAAVHGKNKMRFLKHASSQQYASEWSVSLYRKSSQPLDGYTYMRKVLAPCMIRSLEQAVEYLNETINDKDIKFTIRNGHLQCEIQRDVEVSMENTLRDILGFDENHLKRYTGNRASAKLSLTRRINYFQVYSNIGVNIRVGDTQAPLLTMIPYNPKDCSMLSERIFKKLLYVNLKSNYIPQIHIAIYDDAGELVPFHKDAITSLTLHFRLKA